MECQWVVYLLSSARVGCVCCVVGPLSGLGRVGHRVARHRVARMGATRDARRGPWRRREARRAARGARRSVGSPREVRGRMVTTRCPCARRGACVASRPPLRLVATRATRRGRAPCALRQRPAACDTRERVRDARRRRAVTVPSQPNIRAESKTVREQREASSYELKWGSFPYCNELSSENRDSDQNRPVQSARFPRFCPEKRSRYSANRIYNLFSGRRPGVQGFFDGKNTTPFFTPNSTPPSSLRPLNLQFVLSLYLS